ncbi:MAG: cation:proton antiporter [Rhizobiaceae bacterium]
MDHSQVLLTLGGFLLAGLALDALGRRTRLPRVTLLVLFGIIVGPSSLNLIPLAAAEWYPLVAKIALVMVAFLLGGRLTRSVIQKDGRRILGVSVGAVLLTAATVGAGLWILGFDPLYCLVFAGISTATAPAATEDVVRSSGFNGPFITTLRGAVAIDDAWALIVFSLLLAAGHMLNGSDAAASVGHVVLVEICGAILIGIAIGLPAAYLTGRLKPGEPSLTEALGVVFLCGGLALGFGASYLLATMICGAVIANLARHHTRPFHEIESIEWPFMVVFFILAGASLQIEALAAIGLIGSAYVVLRFVGRVLGGWLGGKLAGMNPVERYWIGFALMPQAGVAMGMALVAAAAFPEQAQSILAIAIGTTIIFELIGPIFTQMAISRVASSQPAGN